MNCIVISGINLFEGGPLSVYYDCLDSIIGLKLYENNKIIAFVHRKALFEKYSKYIEVIEIPKSRKSFIYRLYYEYIYFYVYSKKVNVDIWISLHDMTPRVKAKKQFTYCHNPSPFMQKDVTKIKYSAKNVAFAFFYKYLYRINIKSNTAVIVQQDWIRKAFINMFPISKVIVAKPNISIEFEKNNSYVNNKKVFLYASYPRYFKNFDVICQATKYIRNNNYEIWITLDGKENRYSQELYNLYKDMDTIHWLGIRPREEVYKLYNHADVLIFPSKLETWGLPISEFKLTGKPMMLANLPYAHETVGTYDKVCFFNPDNSHELAKLMDDYLMGDNIFSKHVERSISAPYANNWEELFNIIFEM